MNFIRIKNTIVNLETVAEISVAPAASFYSTDAIITTKSVITVNFKDGSSRVFSMTQSNDNVAEAIYDMIWECDGVDIEELVDYLDDEDDD